MRDLRSCLRGLDLRRLWAPADPPWRPQTSIVETIDAGPERTVALRKLLEAKDAAVRAKLNPGG